MGWDLAEQLEISAADIARRRMLSEGLIMLIDECKQFLSHELHELSRITVLKHAMALKGAPLQRHFLLNPFHPKSLF
jgi:hypothetical protein